MLRYSKGPQPKVLIGWQATPNADWESLPAEDKNEVREAILRDQGHLCAYCQRRIPVAGGHPTMKVEHWRAQSSGEDDLRWTNLLGVCPGDERLETGAHHGEQHCDTSRGDQALFLHPVEGQGPSPRDHLRYLANGGVAPKETTRQRSVSADIEALNLNAARLRRGRLAVYDALKQRLDKAGWSEKALRDEHRAHRTEAGSKAIAYREVARYHVERWARSRGVSL